MESSNNLGQIPIILGRPFLATTNACINCQTRVMDVSFQNKKMRLNIFDTSQGPPIYNHDEINMIEEIVDTQCSILFESDPLQACLTHFEINKFNIDEYTKKVNMLLEPPNFDTTPSWTKKYKQFLTQPSPSMPSLEAPP